jgi:hypothetical protein
MLRLDLHEQKDRTSDVSSYIYKKTYTDTSSLTNKCTHEKSEMIMRNPRVISAFEQSRLSVVLFVSTHRQGSSKYFLNKRK